MNEMMNYWSAESAQVDVSRLIEQPLSVTRIDANGELPAWIILRAEPLSGCVYRWQKANDKGLGAMVQNVWMWCDCVAVPEADSYTLSGNELHTGDRFRCITYMDETPVAVSSYQVSWADERRYRKLLRDEFANLRESVDMNRSYLKQRDDLAAQVEELKAELERSRIDYEDVKVRCREEMEAEYTAKQEKLEEKLDRKLDKMRQWARAWEIRARQAEAQLSALETDTAKKSGEKA